MNAREVCGLSRSARATLLWACACGVFTFAAVAFGVNGHIVRAALCALVAELCLFGAITSGDSRCKQRSR